MKAIVLAGIAWALLIPGWARAQTPPDPSPGQAAPIPTVMTRDPKAAPSDPPANLAHEPSRAQINHYYPRAAKNAKIESFVWLHCKANADQTLDCDARQTNVLDLHSQPLNATPEVIAAFVAAGAAMQNELRAQPILSNGKPSAGHWLLVCLAFRRQG